MKTPVEWCECLQKDGCNATPPQVRAIQKEVAEEIVAALITHEFPLFFPGNRRGTVTVPTEMDEADFGLLQVQVANMLTTVRTVLVVRPIAADVTNGPAPGGAQPP
ncbi:hypothetical protein LCGC14_1218050 [marine sediment metagenome]|uniref:Uncharacterized protein n=1 Tax=marine sediment metagenome TaxID=412755 RepID=A0A0F9NUC4_9ZZZZ